MARKKLLSRDLEKIITKLDSFVDQYDVRGTKEFIKLERLLNDWKISCIVEEELTPKGETVIYNVEDPEEYIDFFSIN